MKKGSHQKTKATVSSQSQSSTTASSSTSTTSTSTSQSEDKLKPHPNPKVNKLQQKARDLKLEFIVEGPITKEEEVIAIVNKSTSPEKHGRKASYPGEQCSPTLTVRSRAQFAAEQGFTWTNDVIGTAKPTAEEVKAMVKVRKVLKALQVTDYGYGLTTLESIPKDSPVFLYEGEIKNSENFDPYALLMEREDKSTFQIFSGQKRGYGGFAQHLFAENAGYISFYGLTPEDKSNIAWENLAGGQPNIDSHRIFFRATNDIPPLIPIGFSYSLFYFKTQNIPMAPFSRVDGFSLSYEVMGFEMDIIYPELGERSRVIKLLEHPTDDTQMQEVVYQETRKAETTRGTCSIR